MIADVTKFTHRSKAQLDFYCCSACHEYPSNARSRFKDCHRDFYCRECWLDCQNRESTDSKFEERTHLAPFVRDGGVRREEVAIGAG